MCVCDFFAEGKESKQGCEPGCGFEDIFDIETEARSLGLVTEYICFVHTVSPF